MRQLKKASLRRRNENKSETNETKSQQRVTMYRNWTIVLLDPGPFGVRLEYVRGPFGFFWAPFGVRSGSFPGLFGVRSESVRGSYWVLSGSVRDPFEGRTGFDRGPFGISSESVRDRSRSVGVPFGVRSESVRANFGSKFAEPKIQNFKHF